MIRKTEWRKKSLLPWTILSVKVNAIDRNIDWYFCNFRGDNLDNCMLFCPCDQFHFSHYTDCYQAKLGLWPPRIWIFITLRMLAAIIHILFVYHCFFFVRSWVPSTLHRALEQLKNIIMNTMMIMLITDRASGRGILIERARASSSFIMYIF